MPRFVIWTFAAFMLVLGLFVSGVQAQTAHGIDVKGIDRGVVVKSPADLYSFANGSWFDRTSIPADKSYVGKFEEIQENNLLVLRDLVEDAAHTKERIRSSPKSLVGELFRIAMDDRQLEIFGGKPLANELRQIDFVHDRASLVAEIGHLESLSVPVGFSLTIRPDAKDSNRMLMTLSQGGQIIPERQVYIDGDDRSRGIRSQYIITISKLLTLAKYSDTASQANASLALETRLAKASSTALELLDPQKNYHLKSFSDLQLEAPSFPWSQYFKGLGMVPPDSVNVSQPKFLDVFTKAVLELPISQWRSYLRSTALYAWSPYLSNEFVKSQFSLSSDISGSAQLSPRWKRAIQTIDFLIGDALGQLYVAKAFSLPAKNHALTMVKNIKSVMRDRLQDLSWLSAASQTKAVKKLDALAIKVGYPDKWRSYRGLAFRRESYLECVFRALLFNWRRNLSMLNRPADRSEWYISPLSVSAYYNPSWNELVLPAGVLQPGLFDDQADSASNYGAIGSIIGHELIHAFDEQGSQYDANGDQRNWWAHDDRINFQNAAEEIVSQYNSYKSQEGLPVNGKLTLDENIADYGGLKIAFMAYHKALWSATPPLRDGLTGDQRFFIAFAQIYRAHYRQELAESRFMNGPTAPDSTRVLGTVSNMKAFYDAFHLSPPSVLPTIW